MTAPDDLARILAEHAPRSTDIRRWSRILLDCSCGEWREDDEAMTFTEHLASVVSRRDADLRTRIEKLRDEIDEGRYLDLAEIVAELAAALDGDTREGAP